MTQPIALPALGASVDELWEVLLDLTDQLEVPWTLIGGQMVLLHALEHGAVPPQVSRDGDVVADIRAAPGALKEVVAVLDRLGFKLEGISTGGVAHRYSRPGRDPGRPVVIDVLAPEGRYWGSSRPDHHPPRPHPPSARRDAGSGAHRAGPGACPASPGAIGGRGDLGALHLATIGGMYYHDVENNTFFYDPGGGAHYYYDPRCSAWYPYNVDSNPATRDLHLRARSAAFGPAPSFEPAVQKTDVEVALQKINNWRIWMRESAIRWENDQHDRFVAQTRALTGDYPRWDPSRLAYYHHGRRY
jgi:hypothetical protein